MINKDISNKITNMAFICACLVVLIHAPDPINRPLTMVESVFRGLTVMPVPVFFMISGFLLAYKIKGGESWLMIVKKRFHTLLIPYWLLSIIWFPIYFGAHYIGVMFWGADGSAETMKLNAYNVFSGLGMLPWESSVLPVMWYVKSLFLLIFISPIIYWLVSNRVVVSFFFVILACVWWGGGKICRRWYIPL